MGICQNEVKRLHDASSSDKSMPSLPPSDGVSPTYGARIRAIGTAITVVGLPCGTNNPGNIVPPRILLPDDFVTVSFDDIVTLLPPSATCWGEHDASDEPYTAVGAFPLPLSDLREHGGGIYPNGTTYYAVGMGTSNRLPIKLGTTFFASSFDDISFVVESSLSTNWMGGTLSHPHSTNGGGERRLGSRPCY
jgi:hypothetical protein